MGLKKRTIKWLAKHGPSTLEGKTVLITGSNSGIGYKTAEVCAFLGANVVLACRSEKKALEAQQKLGKEYPNVNISILSIDLASLGSIDNFVKKIVDDKIDIDVFVSNAGVYHQPGKKTKDNFELVLGVNYFGTYYLMESLLPYLATLGHEVTYINTISLIHKFAKKIDFGDFYFAKKYRNMRVYSRSKLCLAKATYYMAKKYENSNIKILMNHPGIALTPLGLNSVGKLAGLSKIIGWMFNSPEKSSLSVAYILARDFPAGSIVGPNKLFGGWGYPKLNKTRKKVKTGAEELLAFTEKEIALRKAQSK